MITETTSLKYCNSLTSYSRFKTREVYIGDIPLGGNNPIRIQSMTTTDTMDTVATVEQSIRIIQLNNQSELLMQVLIMSELPLQALRKQKILKT